MTYILAVLVLARLIMWFLDAKRVGRDKRKLLQLEESVRHSMTEIVTLRQRVEELEHPIREAPESGSPTQQAERLGFLSGQRLREERDRLLHSVMHQQLPGGQRSGRPLPFAEDDGLDEEFRRRLSNSFRHSQSQRVYRHLNLQELKSKKSEESPRKEGSTFWDQLVGERSEEDS